MVFNTCIYYLPQYNWRWQELSRLDIMTAFIPDDCFRTLGGGWYCFHLCLWHSKKSCTVWSNTWEGRRDLGLWSSASSQSAPQCVRHASAYLMLLYLGCCFPSPPVFQRVAGRLPVLNSVTQVKLVQAFNVVAFLNQLIPLACIGKSLS